MSKPTPLDRLKYHVTGAIERGEKEPIECVPAAVNPNECKTTKFEEALAIKSQLEREADYASECLKRFHRNENGLVLESERMSPEYQSAKLQYSKAFERLRAFNKEFTKHFKNEYAAHRQSRRIR